MSGGGIDTNDIVQYILTGAAGVAGQGMRHMQMAQTNNRKPWMWMVFDMMIALGIGWAVLGLSEWFGIPFKATQSLAILAGWAGPHTMDKIISRSIDKYFGKPQDVDPADKP